MRGHDRSSDRQVGHQLRRAGQHNFAIMLKILKCGDGISQVLNNSFAYVALNALPNHEQTHRRQSRGNQQHGEQEPGAEPGPVDECISGLFRESLRCGFWYGIQGNSAHEFVAHPVHGAEVYRTGWIAFQFLPKLQNMIVNRASGGIILVSPDLVEQLVAADHPVSIL